MLFLFTLFIAAFSSRLLSASQPLKYAFSELGVQTCPEGYIPITTREDCRMAVAFAKLQGLEECGLEDVECKDKKNMGREGKKASCMGVDMTVKKPKFFVAKNKNFNANSRLLCQMIPQCECDHYRDGASESDMNLCVEPTRRFGNLCSPRTSNQDCRRGSTMCTNEEEEEPPTCQDNNAIVTMMIPTMNLPSSPKFPGTTTSCQFLIGFLDAASQPGAGCFLFADLCCATCSCLSNGEVNLGYLTEYRYWLLTIFMGEAFTLEKDEYDDFLENQRFFDANSVATVPVAGEYTGPRAIIEYFLVQNPHYTDRRHYIDPSILADIELLEFSATYIEFTYYATEPNYYINDEPFSRLRAHFQITFSNAFDPFMDTLIVDFEETDVQAMVESFGTNAELCSQIQSSCTGMDAQFIDQSACEEYLDSLPLTQRGCPKLKGPTRACKWTHMILAQDELRPEIHCYHVGPGFADPFGVTKCSIADCH